MTETEWMTCNDPRPMLGFLCGRTTDRKLRLFAVACCRRISDLLPDERCRLALETAEQFADGLVSLERLHAAREDAIRSYVEFNDFDESGGFTGRESAAAAIGGACWTAEEGQYQGLHDVIDNSYGLGHLSTDGKNSGPIEFRRQCHDIRDIFGNPFQARSLTPTWFTPEVVKVAQAIYDGQAFDRLHELADALEREGCDDAASLAHCHAPGPHVRGCWVVDAALGRT